VRASGLPDVVLLDRVYVASQTKEKENTVLKEEATATRGRRGTRNSNAVREPLKK
jgi:hypothetical protein